MKNKKILFSIAIILYVLQLIFKRNHIYLPVFVNSYLADILCLPILLSISLFAIQRIKRSTAIYLTWKMILFTCVYVSIVFEYLLPMYSSRYTSDPWDVIAYFIGGLVFYLLQPKRIWIK